LSNHANTAFIHARDELFSHVHRCQVLQAAPEQQSDWLRDTVQFLGESFPTLTDRELNELREIGERFCQPPIPHGKGHTELTRDQWQHDDAADAQTVAAA
jgi:hypothetical protein